MVGEIADEADGHGFLGHLALHLVSSVNEFDVERAGEIVICAALRRVVEAPHG